jgi:predicted nucleotidyltransferase
MQNTEDRLVEYLKEKYNLVAIVLHGSRANGMSKEHSDWDFVIFTKSDVKPVTREIINDSNIEVKQIILPVLVDVFLGFFFRTDNIKILYDPESIAKNLLILNEQIIKEGNKFEEVDKSKRYTFLVSALDGIGDYADDPLIMFDKKIDFYTRIVESWFRFSKHEFEPSHYFAFPKIKKDDFEFYTLIESFVTAHNSKELMEIGKQILHHLFPDLNN